MVAENGLVFTARDRMSARNVEELEFAIMAKSVQSARFAVRSRSVAILAGDTRAQIAEGPEYVSTENAEPFALCVAEAVSAYIPN